jgi:hypothetical protein
MNDILEFEFNKTVDCSKEIAMWNYWDHEHLDVVHGGYKQSDILYDDKNFMFRIDKVKIPFLPFITPTTPIFTVQHDDNTICDFVLIFGVLSRTIITISALERTKCKITMNYKFHLNGWRKILKPILKRLVPIWNEKVWIEDLPVKLRRQKVLDMNFKDFIGLPGSVDEREIKSNYKLKLPIPRPKNSSRDKHPLKKDNI